MDYLKSITMELNITCIVNLHQVEIARSYSDRIIGLSKGGIVFDGPSYRLSTDSTDLIYGTKTVEKRQLVTV